MEILVTLDDRQFAAWAAQTLKVMNSQLRSAVDRSARAARAATIPIMAADSNLSPRDFRKAVPLVRGATAENLTAVWKVGSAGNFIRRAGGGRLAPVKRGQVVTASSFTLTGGGSANLTLRKPFSLAGGGVYVRIGAGRNAVKGIYSASPATMLSQEDGAARKKWLDVAADASSLLIAGAIQAALNGSSTPPAASKYILADSP